MTDETAGDFIERAAIVNLGQGVGEGLLFNELLLQGGGNEFFSDAADFQPAANRIGIELGDECYQTQGQGAGHVDFKVTVVVFDNRGRQHQCQQPKADK